MGQEPHREGARPEAGAGRAGSEPDEHRIRQRAHEIW